MKLSSLTEDYDHHQDLDWVDYVVRSGYSVESLGRLFHGTSRSNVESILTFGLDPDRADPAHVEDERLFGDDFGYGPPFAFVYLSIFPEVCSWFSPGGVYNPVCDSGDAVLLEVRLPEFFQRKLILDRGEFIRAPFVIPPKFISVVGG